MRVKTLKRTTGISANPAGKLMNVRSTGITRVDEHGELPALLEPGFGAVQLVGADTDAGTPSLGERPSAEVAHGVGDPGADEAAEHADHTDEHQVERGVVPPGRRPRKTSWTGPRRRA